MTDDKTLTAPPANAKPEHTIPVKVGCNVCCIVDVLPSATRDQMF
jgi:hypothetical protein